MKPFPKVGQRVRIKPPVPPGSLLADFAHLIGKVVELEPEYRNTSMHNGLRNIEMRLPVAYEERGALVVFGNSAERLRIPLNRLEPA